MVKLLYILYGKVQIVSMFISIVFLVNAQTFDWATCFTRIWPQKIAYFFIVKVEAHNWKAAKVVLTRVCLYNEISDTNGRY
uniref:Putative ovule protein n=1 Tax=Solanum chacoense TaxID=4108 RepID=A0A0V0H1H0_SOLCH